MPIPTRAFLDAAPREYVHRGSSRKADIFIVRSEQGEIVVKDFSAKGPLIRWIGRFQTARECRAYRALEGVEGVVRWLGRIDAHALALESLEGALLQKFRKNDRRKALLGEIG